MNNENEQNSFFGGMVVPSWNSYDKHISDPSD